MSKEIKDKQVELDGVMIPNCEKGGKQHKSRLNEINYNNRGSKMKIIEYNNCNDIVVEFENGYKIKTIYKSFKSGSLKSPYDKTILGVGVVGLENCYAIDEEYTRSYDRWRGMLTRCYNDKEKNKNPTYKDVICCNEWLFYPNFKEWYDNNYYEIDNEKMCLDKDILIKGNKIYSPETCVFVPQNINKLFVKSDANRGKYPIGVGLHRKTNRYRAYCNNGSLKIKSLCYHDTIEQAFEVYKEYKENYIKEVADKYKDRIPQILYNAMKNWVVEITD